MMTSAIYGHKLVPAVLADEKGNAVRVEQAASPQWLEGLLRPVIALSQQHACQRQLHAPPLLARFFYMLENKDQAAQLLLQKMICYLERRFPFW